MAPAQPLAVIRKAKVAVDKEDKFSLQKCANKGIRCMSSCEEAMFGMEAFLEKHTKVPVEKEDVEADIIECTSTSKTRLPEAVDPDETEYSSSFGDTVSGTDNCSGLSEAEVESRFCDDNGLTSAFDAFNDTFHKRKKKVTRHWRNFIRPLMWRCKWTELRMMEVESQALNYARELAKYDQGKLSYVDQSTLETFGSKSLPFSGQYHRKKAMRRRKRRRVEDITDVGSYMLHHNLFSYLESKRTDADSAGDDFGNPVATDQNVHGDNEFGFSDDQSSLESKNRQNSLEKLLLKIEVVQTRVHQLRTQIDCVMSKHAVKFSSSENLSLIAPCEAQTSCAPSPTFSVGNGDAVSVGPVHQPTQHIPEFDIGDLVIPDTDLSSYGEGIHIPDIIESTMELLSADAIFNQRQTGDSCEDIVDDVLMHSQVADIETHTFNEISNNQAIGKHHQEPVSAGKQEAITNAAPDLVPESVTMPQEQSTLESSLVSECHAPRTKRKRGERKAGSGVWSRRCSGEPDSQ